jgi:pilus assembly protein CpaE
MQIYFFTAGVESSELTELESRIRSKLPSLRKLAKIDAVTSRLGEGGATASREQSYIIFPMLTASTFERILSITEQQDHRGVFFIFVSREISATDYKRLVRSGSADWVSLQGAPQEIFDIVSRTSQTEMAAVGAEQARPAIVAFVPSGGGVGNATLALETAVQIKLDRKSRDRRICLLDLDLQASHICDHLDIEPRLQIHEIIQNPERLDAQLFDVFISHHATSGIDVLAPPRSRTASIELSMAALDALFHMISDLYDLVIVDLPPAWFDWTMQIISVSDLAIVTGLNNVPGLRQVSATLETLKSAERIPPQIVVALNRCESGLLGRVARRQDASRVFGRQTVVYVREDSAAANRSLNTGMPISMTNSSNKIAKDIRVLARLVSAVVPAHDRIAPLGHQVVPGTDRPGTN